jgi:hypothetical protein
MTPRARCGRSLTRILGRWRHRAARHRFSRHRLSKHRLSKHRLSRHRLSRSLRRELWALEEALEADAPKLASMFEVFNLLTRYERPVGIEPLASSAPLVQTSLMPAVRRRSAGQAKPARQRRLAAIATVLALAVVAACCFAISTQPRPTGRSCLVGTPAGLGYTVSRVPGCTPYPAKK